MQRSVSLTKISMFSPDVTNVILEKFKSIAAQLSADKGLRKPLSKDVYLFTKNFLDAHAAELSSADKGRILAEYIKLWGKSKFDYPISETSFASLYAHSRFYKYHTSYNSAVPMLAGFNLENADLSEISAMYMIFPSVNLKGANFGDSCFAYTHFENCDLSDIKTCADSNLNQCQFVSCNLTRADLRESRLCEALFRECDITDFQFEEQHDYPASAWFSECTTTTASKAGPVC